MSGCACDGTLPIKEEKIAARSMASSRVATLRQLLKANNLHAYLVPEVDAHQVYLHNGRTVFMFVVF